MSPESSLNGALLNSVLHIPYIQIFGELSLDEILSSPNDTDPHAYPNPSTTNYIGFVLVGCYFLFTNILLINLLIARFGWTYSDILANAKHTCAKEMAVLLDEFEETFILPGPFPIVKRIYRIHCPTTNKNNSSIAKDGTEALRRYHTIAKEQNAIESTTGIADRIGNHQFDMGRLTAEIQKIIRNEFGRVQYNKQKRKQKPSSHT